jgi:hypothetical protein
MNIPVNMYCMPIILWSVEKRYLLKKFGSWWPCASWPAAWPGGAWVSVAAVLISSP